jgi:hypothetical protein
MKGNSTEILALQEVTKESLYIYLFLSHQIKTPGIGHTNIEMHPCLSGYLFQNRLLQQTPS